MRRKLFNWHVLLGTFAGILIFIWALSGATMTLEPLLLRHVERGLPKFEPPSVRPANFHLPVAALPVPEASAVVLREFHGRSWYEVTTPSGNVLGFDAHSGKPVDPTLPMALVLEDLGTRLRNTPWALREAELLEKHSDVYRKGRLPVYQVRLDGPEAVILFISARDANVEKISTRWSRLTRWLGLGIHTWNFQTVIENHDDLRSVLLAGLVALPLASMAVISYALLLLRRRALARKAVRRVRR